MKRKIAISLILTLIIGLMPLQSFATDDIKVMINGQILYFDVNPQIINNRTMVPMRAIFEDLGMTVDYSNGNITAKDNSDTIKMTVGVQTINKNGNNISIDTAPIIVNNRTLVPVRAISECLDSDVQWNGSTRTVNITTNRTVNIKQYINLNDYKYLAGSDFREIKSKYPSAKGQFASMVYYTNKDNHLCVLVDIWYTIINNYEEVILHDLTAGNSIKDPKNYYHKMANTFYGSAGIHYLDLSEEFADYHLIALKRLAGQNQEGIFISGEELEAL